MCGAREARLAELLDLWEEAAERGEQLDPRELCADSPELLPDLTRQIEKLRAMDARLKQEPEATVPVRRDGGGRRTTEETRASFQLVERLAQGGLGVVYRARDGELHRDVVLKFIHTHIARSEEHRLMFRREAEVTSRLDHPGVVPVYGIGESRDGRIFYAMRYIQGETLDDAIARLHSGRHRPGSRSPLELRNLLARFVTVCKTIAYAHNRGIIHRDIKPANVMLGRYGETLVVDWGLATPVGRDEAFKLSDEKTLMPSDGGGGSSDRGAGTPAYMSPEAARGEPLLTPASDIYSLGATFYKLLTGKTAFDAPGIEQLRRQVVQGDFAPPRKRKRSISKALEAICLKAMAGTPERRYATALEMAADIESYLADEPVSTYREPLPRRAARWARRHRGLAQAILIAVSLLALVTVLSAAGLGYLARSEYEARRAAEAAKRQSLRMSSRFAARTIGGQIDVRWRILEAAGKDSAIREALLDIDQAPGERSRWQPAQAWLNEQFIQWRERHDLDLSSLFVMDARGMQIARSPTSDSIGQSFAFRDYFHGRGRDLDPAEAREVAPIRDANLSATYSSTTSGKLKVAFTVPVHSDDAVRPRVLGVLGMSVELGDFGVLDSDLQSGQIVVLVDARPDALNGELRRGLVLQHPNLTQEGAVPETVRIESDSLRAITAVRGGFLPGQYKDPLAEGRWLAAFEQVLVEARRAPIGNTGWIVLVQERVSAD